MTNIKNKIISICVGPLLSILASTAAVHSNSRWAKKNSKDATQRARSCVFWFVIFPIYVSTSKVRRSQLIIQFRFIIAFLAWQNTYIASIYTFILIFSSFSIKYACVCVCACSFFFISIISVSPLMCHFTYNKCGPDWKRFFSLLIHCPSIRMLY